MGEFIFMLRYSTYASCALVDKGLIRANNPVLVVASPAKTRRRERQSFFSREDAADYVFHLQIGRARLIVVAINGKEANYPDR